MERICSWQAELTTGEQQLAKSRENKIISIESKWTIKILHSLPMPVMEDTFSSWLCFVHFMSYGSDINLGRPSKNW